MQYLDALKYLDSFLNYERFTDYRYGQAFSLDRIERLLGKLGNPHRAYPAIHVAGTKGKGSTCALTASVLSAAGLKTGLYTSPHLLTFRERIQVGGRLISEPELAEIVEALSRHADKDLTYFEAVTACALLYFSKIRVDVAVLEVGMGGRLDATNAVLPEISAITPIGLDHMAKLGHTLEAIAREKAGIIKEAVPVVVGRQRPEALGIIEETARRRDAPLHRLDREVEAADLHLSVEGTEVSFKTAQRRYPGVRVPLLGRHQVDNAGMALRIGELFADKILRRPITPAAVREGVSRARWPGRCQILKAESRTWLLDGAQSADSARALRETAEQLFPGRRVWLIAGASTEKDLAGIANAWERWAHRLITTQADVPRAEPAGKLAEIFQDAAGSAPRSTFTVQEALQTAQEETEARDLIVVSGSLFVVAETLKVFSGAFPKTEAPR